MACKRYSSHGRASIITSEIMIRVFCKEQLDEAIDWLRENNFNFSWTTEMGDSLNPNVYLLEVHEMSWANNLVALGRILANNDYSFDEKEDD